MLSHEIVVIINIALAVGVALIGGMVVRYGGIVLDGSLRGRLEKIERGLTD